MVFQQTQHLLFSVTSVLYRDIVLSNLTVAVFSQQKTSHGLLTDLPCIFFMFISIYMELILVIFSLLSFCFQISFECSGIVNYQS